MLPVEKIDTLALSQNYQQNITMTSTISGSVIKQLINGLKDNKRFNIKSLNKSFENMFKSFTSLSIGNKITTNKVDVSNDMIEIKDIDLFYTNTSKRFNDKNNKIRENILIKIDSLSNEYFENNDYGYKWIEVRNNWNITLQSLSNKNYTSITIIKMAGRKYNYDFKVIYKYNNEIVDNKNLEFKYNVSSLNKLPQIKSLYDIQCLFIENTYSEYYYKFYLPNIISLIPDFKEPIPSLDIYLKYVNDIYYKHPFFKELKSKITSECSNIAKQSIFNYIEIYSKHIDLNKLSINIYNSQCDKIFVLWYKNKFIVETIPCDGLKISKILEIKKSNIILETTNDKIKFKLNLRWANNIGVCNPCWQIYYNN